MAAATRRLALVTGGARGLGFEIARQLIDRGLRVAVAARDLDAARAASADLGPLAHPITLDVTRPHDARDAVTELYDRFGRLDVLVNNAGVTDNQAAVGLDPAVIDAVMAVNVTGAWRTANAAIPPMTAHGYGRIVNISSNLGSLATMTSASEPAYRVSKAALNALTRVLAAELASSGILVNAASPGWCRTAMGGPNAPRTPAEGAATPVWLATLPEGDTRTGGLYYDRELLPW